MKHFLSVHPNVWWSVQIMKLLLSLHSNVWWSVQLSYSCRFTLMFSEVCKSWNSPFQYNLVLGEVYKWWSYSCLFTLMFGEVYKSWDSPLTLLVSRTISKAIPSPTVRYKCRWISKSYPVRASRARYLVTPLNYNAALYSRSEHTHCGTVKQIWAHTLWHCKADLRTHIVALYSRSEHTHCGTVKQIWAHIVAL